MVDVVEYASQIGVKNPPPFCFAAQGLEQGSYRVVAAATRPKPVGSGFESGLPLGFECVSDPCLVASVHDHWNAERAHLGLVTGFRDVHPSDREGLPRASG